MLTKMGQCVRTCLVFYISLCLLSDCGLSQKIVLTNILKQRCMQSTMFLAFQRKNRKLYSVMSSMKLENKINLFLESGGLNG